MVKEYECTSLAFFMKLWRKSIRVLIYSRSINTSPLALGSKSESISSHLREILRCPMRLKRNYDYNERKDLINQWRKKSLHSTNPLKGIENKNQWRIRTERKLHFPICPRKN